MSKKRKNGNRIVLSILCIMLGVVLLLFIGATIYVEGLLGKINREDVTVQNTMSQEEIQSFLEETDPVDDEPVSEVLEPEDVVLAEGPAELIEETDHILNILLIGQDRRENQGRQRSDSMILCTIDLEEKTLVMTSFLRDLYVEIPDWNGDSYSDNRLNVNYAIGGMGMLDKCLELNFGVSVDNNIEVDFSGFEEIVDILGGVDINLTSAEANWLGDGLEEGMNHLNGAQALTYSRIRKLDSDFGRTNRQRNVLTALLNKAKSMSLTELNALINSFMPLITTDMTNYEIIQYVGKIFPILSELELTTQYIPAAGTYTGASIRGMSVLVPDMEANRQILRDTLG